MVIDIDRAQRVLQIKWTHDHLSSSNGYQCTYQLKTAFALDSVPYVCLDYNEDRQPQWVNNIQRKYPKFGWFARFFVHYSRRPISIDSSGTVHDPSLFPYFMYPPTPGNDTITGIFSNGDHMAEFEMVDGQLKKVVAWKEGGMPSNRFLFEDGYFGFNVRTGSYFFYHRTEPPSVREISNGELCTLIPDMAGSMQLELIPLFAHADRPGLFSVNNVPGFPIFEIQSDRIKKGSASDIFKRVDEGFEDEPFCMMQNNEVLLLTSVAMIMSDILPPDQAILVSKREKNPDGTWGEFSHDLTELKPARDRRFFCRYPLDEERLLYFHEGRFWTAKWDGSFETCVFPLVD